MYRSTICLCVSLLACAQSPTPAPLECGEDERPELASCSSMTLGVESDTSEALYDACGRIESRVDRTDNGTVERTADYHYDPDDGRLLSIDEVSTLRDIQTQYLYDSADRLARVETWIDGELTYEVVYEYPSDDAELPHVKSYEDMRLEYTRDDRGNIAHTDVFKAGESHAEIEHEYDSGDHEIRSDYVQWDGYTNTQETTWDGDLMVHEESTSSDGNSWEIAYEYDEQGRLVAQIVPVSFGPEQIEKTEWTCPAP